VLKRLVKRLRQTWPDTLAISFAIFHPCEGFNPMKMPRQSQLQ